VKAFVSHITTVALGILLPVLSLAAAAWYTSSRPVVKAEPIHPPLVGHLAGPEVITDLSSFPTRFAEAPILAERVASGDLPPLSERLPMREDLLVLQPLEETGKYGGTWRRGFTGPAARGERQPAQCCGKTHLHRLHREQDQALGRQGHHGERGWLRIHAQAPSGA
jgi:hypothetical protein